MKNIFFTLSITFIIVHLNYKVSAQKTVNFTFEDFVEVIELEGEKMDLKDILFNPTLITLSDSFLFVKNPRANPVVDVINLQTGETLSRFCKRGRGPGELVAPFSVQYIEKEKRFLVQDLAGKKVVYFDLDLILNHAPKKSTNSFNFDEATWVRKVVQLKNGNLFCNLIGHKDGYMNCLLDSEGKLIRFLDQYPELDIPFNKEYGSNIFGTFLSISPAQDKVIMPYTSSDIISVYDVDGNKTIEFVGPNYKKLDVVYSNGSAGRTNRNNEAYNHPCANAKTFMIPYNGKKYKYAHSPAYDIFHLGFDGSLLQHFKVKPSVTNIAIDWENRIIYGINKDMEPCIYKYKF